MLKPGDTIRVIKIPSSVTSMPASMRDGPDGTLRVCQRIKDRGRGHKIDEVTTHGTVWISYVFRNKKGRVEYHHLAVESDCVELVTEQPITNTRRACAGIGAADRTDTRRALE
jgi:hypothetical protein